VANILKEHGVEPAPKRRRQTTWKTFLKAHWDVLAAVDFTSVEVWTKNGLITFYLLMVIELAARRIHFAGTTVSPEDPWMQQIARNLMAADDGFLLEKTRKWGEPWVSFSVGSIWAVCYVTTFVRRTSSSAGPFAARDPLPWGKWPSMVWDSFCKWAEIRQNPATNYVQDSIWGSFGRVEKWRGGFRYSLSVAGPFVCRCLTSCTLRPFPLSAHQTGQADFPHPAFGQGLMLWPTERCGRTSGVG
jgi:hypothetical protein